MRVRVAACVVHDGRVLLVDTKRGAGGYAVPPGGGVEAGETLTEAVCREVLEEAGLRVAAGRMIAYRELRTDRGLALEMYFTACLCDGASPDGVSGEDRGLHWVTPEQLADLPHYPERLAELLALVASDAAGAVYLGVADLTGFPA